MYIVTRRWDNPKPELTRTDYQTFEDRGEAGDWLYKIKSMKYSPAWVSVECAMYKAKLIK